MPSKKISSLILMPILFLAVIFSANYAGAAVEWTPMVRIPGLPPTGTVNLSMYLIGLYNFMLSIVGIVAVVMLIIGGMRYITAVGNPTAISDAKDIINSAITGLILALLSWVFISAINPDILYIKQPGSKFDTNQVVKDLGNLPVTTTPSPCIKPGSEPRGTNGKCTCINESEIPIAGTSCQDTCAVNNCFVADFRIGSLAINDPKAASYATDIERAKAYATTNTKFENPLSFSDSCVLFINAADYSVGQITAVGYDVALNDSYGMPVPGGYQGLYPPVGGPYFCTSFSYAFGFASPRCTKVLNDTSVVCPVKLKFTFIGGIEKFATQYIKIYSE